MGTKGFQVRLTPRPTRTGKTEKFLLGLALQERKKKRKKSLQRFYKKGEREVGEETELFPNSSII